MPRIVQKIIKPEAALAWPIEHGRPIDASGSRIEDSGFGSGRNRRQVQNLLGPPKTLSRIGLMWFTQGDLERARSALGRAVALGRSVGEVGVVGSGPGRPGVGGDEPVKS